MDLKIGNENSWNKFQWLVIVILEKKKRIQLVEGGQSVGIVEQEKTWRRYNKKKQKGEQKKGLMCSTGVLFRIQKRTKNSGTKYLNIFYFPTKGYNYI